MSDSDLVGGVGGRRLPRRPRAVRDDEWLRGGTEFQRWAMNEIREWVHSMSQDYDVRHEISTEFHYLYFGKPGPGNAFQLKWYYQSPKGHHLRFYLNNATAAEETHVRAALSRLGRQSCKVSKSRGFGFNAYSEEDIGVVKDTINARLDAKRR